MARKKHDATERLRELLREKLVSRNWRNWCQRNWCPFIFLASFRGRPRGRLDNGSPNAVKQENELTPIYQFTPDDVS